MPGEEMSTKHEAPYLYQLMTTWGKRQRTPHEPCSQDSRYPPTCAMGDARIPQALDKRPVGCVPYTIFSPSALRRNHTEQGRSSVLAIDAEVLEGPWFRRSRTVPQFSSSWDSRFLLPRRPQRQFHLQCEGECCLPGGLESRANQRTKGSIRIEGHTCVNDLGAVDKLQST